MSLYIKLFNGFFNHRKTNKLKARLGTDAWWIPVRIWSYAAENQPDGIFDGYTAEELAIAIGYTGDAKEMLQALLDACFMDSEPLAIHNWAEHNGFHSEFAGRAKKAAEARWAKDKERRAEVLRKKEPKKEDMIGDEMRGDETSIACSNACSMLVASGASAPSPLPSTDDLLQAWNEMAAQSGINKVEGFTDKRKKHFRVRLSDAYFLANWREAITRIGKSTFCRGDNDRGWTACLDFFLRPDSVMKIMEGKYDGKPLKKLPEANQSKEDIQIPIL